MTNSTSWQSWLDLKVALMCVNYSPVKPHLLAHLQSEQDFCHVWRAETWQDYEAPIIVHDEDGRRRLLLASYGMVPKRKASTDARKYTTMNARAETVAQLVTFRREWRAARFCLVPMERFFEPYYADDRPPPERYAIGMADRSLFAVAGLWRSWAEEGGDASYSFTQLTINSDGHPLMSRFHKPGDEKRSLVIVPRECYDDWLGCDDPEQARSFLNLFPAPLMAAEAAPLPPREAKGSL